METLSFKRELDVRAPAGKLWPLLSNTDRINRAMGLPPVTYAPSPDPLVRLARARFFGFLPVVWDEHPFEWVEPRFYQVRRVYHGGPLEEMVFGVRATPDGSRTHLEVYADTRPRHAAGTLVARHLSPKRELEDFRRQCLRLEEAVLGTLEEPFERRSGRAPADAERLRAMVRDLGGKADPRILARLARHLEEAYDEDLVRMRPFALADRWGLERLDVLSAFLHAARYGALDAHWDLLCPGCRGSKTPRRSLAEAKAGGHCDSCHIDYGADFEKNVELRFTVHPSVRAAADLTFCVGGPANTPHRWAQVRVPSEGRSVSLELPARRFVVRGLSGRNRLILKPDPSRAAAPVLLSFEDGEPRPGGVPGGKTPPEVRASPEGIEIPFRPGEVELRLASAGAPAWAALEEEAWTDQAATAAFVTTLQDFRDLFAAEALSPGEEVSIKSLALLFTDIKGSTALYERIGDAKAYGLVRDHFEILYGAVRGCRGGIVKTIGDAVMAVFSSGADAAEAACLIQERFRAFNKARPPGREEVIVKVGVHLGPALVINAGGVLDYFGTTVNIAARVQSESVGGDIVLSAPMVERARPVLERRGAREETFEISLKGLSGKFKLWRIRLKPE